MWRKKLLTILVLPLFLFALFLVIPSPAQAQTQEWGGVCVASDVQFTGKMGSDGKPIENPLYGVATIQGAQCVIANILSIAVSFVGLAGFVMLIVGAFRFLVSGGNSKGIEDGKKTLTFAFTGLVVAVSAIIILTLIANFTGVQSILNFKIPNSETPF